MDRLSSAKIEQRSSDMAGVFSFPGADSMQKTAIPRWYKSLLLLILLFLQQTNSITAQKKDTPPREQIGLPRPDRDKSEIE